MGGYGIRFSFCVRFQCEVQVASSEEEGQRAASGCFRMSCFMT